MPFAPGAGDPYSSLGSAEWRGYFEEYGYVVIRGLIPSQLCQRARAAFEREIKPYTGHLYRQASAALERHQFTEHGYMLNSLLNLQDLRTDQFPSFSSAALGLLSCEALQSATESVLGEPGRLVQSMYFEGNPVTWAHQDTYYLDADKLGAMAGAWIALEGIHPGAGRFYVYPGSHRIDMARNGGDFDIAFNHDRYKQLVIDVINRNGLECHAPALQEGDVLFWASRTIHGSLETTASEHSRNSITAHFIPRSTRFMQYQTRVRRLNLQKVNGLEIHCPKDQQRWPNRLALRSEILLGPVFRHLKRLAIKVVTR